MRSFIFSESDDPRVRFLAGVGGAGAPVLQSVLALAGRS